MSWLTRRQSLAAASAGLAASIVPAAFAADVKPTPSCGAKVHMTIADDEGPYFKPSSPTRTTRLCVGR